MDIAAESQSRTDVLENIEEPHLFNVIMLNDDYTTMDFVVDVLISIYHKSSEDAVLLMTKIHRAGKAIVGVYPYDIAATLVAQTKTTARTSGFPLRCEMEAI